MTGGWQKGGAHGGEGWCQCAIVYGHADVEAKPYLCVCGGLLRPAGCRCVAAAAPSGPDPYGIAAAWRGVRNASVRVVMEAAIPSTAESRAAYRAYQQAKQSGEVVAKSPEGEILTADELAAVNEAVRVLRGHASGEVVCALPPCADLRGSFDVRAAFAAAVR